MDRPTATTDALLRVCTVILLLAQRVARRTTWSMCRPRRASPSFTLRLCIEVRSTAPHSAPPRRFSTGRTCPGRVRPKPARRAWLSWARFRVRDRDAKARPFQGARCMPAWHWQRSRYLPRHAPLGPRGAGRRAGLLDYNVELSGPRGGHQDCTAEARPGARHRAARQPGRQVVRLPRVTGSRRRRPGSCRCHFLSVSARLLTFAPQCRDAPPAGGMPRQQRVTAASIRDLQHP